MVLTQDILDAMESSVLCWLATSSFDGEPNVSPKQMFIDYDESIIVANIASPETVKNIKNNPKVCLSFIDVLIQKGVQLKGLASIIDKEKKEFARMEHRLNSLLKDDDKVFPIKEIIKIDVVKSKQIIAPSYFLYPNTREQDLVKQAKEQYQLK